MKSARPWLIATLLTVLAAVAVSVWLRSRTAAESVEPAATVVAPPPVAPVSAPPDEPAPPVRLQLDTRMRDPLPAIDDSDATLGRLLADGFGRDAWRDLFRHERLVRRIVATVDNLPRREAPVGMWPLKPAAGWLATQSRDGAIFIAPENSGRYAAYVAWFQRLDAERAVALYLRFYPLFQEAYEALGFPGAYFNDRLKVAIDDLLATPEPEAPPTLAPDNVRYRFADPALDQRSAGQKILLRMGADHTRIVKAKLREIRRALARHERPAAG